MIILRYLFFPFSIVYGIIISIRNFLFDIGIFTSYTFDIPILAVGNLSVGGTGKTPQIEYLIRLLSPNYKIATLSRGYKRTSKGFILADSNSNAEILGDEPFQIYQKFPSIKVAVDANRKNGIEQLLQLPDKPDVILLDDAFQHRKVKASFYILLTAYGDLFCDDCMLPTGNLRESKNGAQRADLFIITKCPRDLPNSEQEKIKNKIGVAKPIFFSFIDYEAFVFNETESKSVAEIKNTEKLLLAGIAKPEPFFAYLRSKNNEQMVFPDHHHFTESDLNEIKNKAKNKLIITTEKDFVRLKNQNLKSLFYLPIKTSFLPNNEEFDDKIFNAISSK
jgi:tetraacyldisaccharide 4'-kinase